MNDPLNDDPMLRERFASLRRAEEARVPGFERVMARAGRRTNRGLWRLAMAASVALAAATVVTVQVSHPQRSAMIHAAAPMLADWRAPTDFLLDTPVRELLHTVPDMGRQRSPGLNDSGTSSREVPVAAR